MDPAATIADIVTSMNKGQYLLLIRAIEAAGGELRIDWREFAEASQQPSPKCDIDGDDGPVVIRLE